MRKLEPAERIAITDAINVTTRLARSAGATPATSLILAINRVVAAMFARSYVSSLRYRPRPLALSRRSIKARISRRT